MASTGSRGEEHLRPRIGGPGGDTRRPVAPPEVVPTDGSPPLIGARFAYDLAFFARLTANLRAEVIGDTPDGYRINFFVVGGRIEGPEIHAQIRPEGGDWMAIRPDGLGIVDINITYDTAGGALILEQAGGVFQLDEEGLARAKRGQFIGSPPFYATPRWVTAAPEWAHLNQVQGFGIGRVVLEELQVQCDIYHPHVGRRLDE